MKQEDREHMMDIHTAESRLSEALRLFQDIRDPELPQADFVYQYPPSITLGRPPPWELKQLPESLALYVHVPFCPTRCAFCHYYRITDPEPALIEEYHALLSKELELWRQKIQKLGDPKSIQIPAIYLGGGTPTYLASQGIRHILDSIRKIFNVRKSAEICVEATPDTIPRKKLEDLKRIGVTRISIGVQSFQNQLLQKLNRSHSAEQAKRAIQDAKDLFSINIDLLYGYQSPMEWLDDLATSIELAPDFITAFRLRAKPGTPIQLPEGLATRRGLLFMHWLAIQELEEAGYSMLYNNQWAKEGTFAFQDIKWKGDEFIGLGPSSYSYVDGLVCNNYPRIQDYRNSICSGKLPFGVAECLEEDEQHRRTEVLGIRSADGIPERGLDTKDLERQGLIERAGDRIRATRKGMLFMDEISASFFSESVRRRMEDAQEQGIEAAAIQKSWED